MPPITRRQTAKSSHNSNPKCFFVLPDEILLIIFKLSVETTIPSYQWVRVITLSHVSARWRAVAISSTMLWTALIIRKPSNFPLIPMFANRSHHRRLHLMVNVRSRGGASVETQDAPLEAEILPSFAAKILTIIFMSPSNFHDMLVGDEALAQVDLELLTIEASRPTNYEHFYPRPLLRRTRCLKLKDVYATIVDRPYTLDILEEFHLTQSGLGDAGMWRTFRHLRMPGLRRLVLHRISDSAHRDRGMVEFPLLESVELRHCHDSLPELIGDNIVAPKLRSITIRRQTTPHRPFSGLTIKQMVKRQEQLKHLVLLDNNPKSLLQIILPEEEELGLLSLTQSLQSLVLIACPPEEEGTGFSYDTRDRRSSTPFDHTISDFNNEGGSHSEWRAGRRPQQLRMPNKFAPAV
ncbi:hypothetical protein DL93DRAFT_2099784 [Clavulina sp. PMI_390]|nr:hypothetical protein DL93DRAFT_2099784 [Clavulina sp. PMI_390]